MNNLVAIVSGSMILKAGAAILQLLMLMLISRNMTQADYGLFGYLFSIATLSAVFSSLGVRNGLLKYGAIYFNKGSLKYNSLFQYSLVFTSALVLGFSPVLFFAAPADLEVGRVFWAGIGLAFVVSVSEVFAHALRAQGKIKGALLYKDIYWRLSIVILTSILYFGFADVPERMELSFIVIFMVVTLLLLLIVQFFMSGLHEIFFSTPIVKYSEVKYYSKILRPFWGSIVLRDMLQPVLVYIVAVRYSPAEAALFFAAQRISLSLNLLMMAVDLSIASKISVLHFEKKYNELACLFKNLNKLTVPATIAIFLLILVFGKDVLSLFGDEYATAYPILISLSGVYMLSILSGPSRQALELTGLQGYYLLLLAISTVSTLVLIFLLAGKVSLLSISLIFLGFEFMRLVLCVHKCKEHFGIDPSAMNLFRNL